MPIITFVGSTGASALNGGNATITYPGQYSSNACAIVAVTLGTSRTTALAVASSSGAAFTQIVATIVSSNARFGVFRRLLGSSAETQCTVTGSALAVDSTTSVLMLFRDVDATTPEDATATSTTGSGTAPLGPSITVVSCGCAIITAVGISLNSAPTAPSSFLNATSKATTDTDPATTAQAWITNKTTAVYTPTAWTSTTASWCSATIALRPISSFWYEMGYIGADPVVMEANRTVIRSY
jgi:hypothetical protein